MREDSSATTPSQTKGAREELEKRGAVLLPGTGMAHGSPNQTSVLKGAGGLSQRIPIKDAPVPQDATPSTSQTKYYRELSALRDAFFPKDF